MLNVGATLNIKIYLFHYTITLNLTSLKRSKPYLETIQSITITEYMFIDLSITIARAKEPPSQPIIFQKSNSTHRLPRNQEDYKSNHDDFQIYPTQPYFIWGTIPYIAT